MNAYQLGIAGEEIAVERMRQEGLQIIEQRWKDHAYEIDIIAFDPITAEMVFAEVKCRTSNSHGRPEDAIDGRKIMRIVRAANHFMRSRNLDYSVRFDVFSITLPKSGNAKIEYYKDAFYAPLG